jgi:rSAM/selenodomain-associated transferase 2/rSAM/selenodomain-associated transferase 1
MQSHRNDRRDRLIILGRYPIPGQTKTRLIPALGPTGAADLQRRLTEKTLATAKAFALKRRTDVEFRFKGGNVRKMRCWLGSGLSFSPQAGGDLGDRMQSVFFDAFLRGARRVVLLGTDIPALNTENLQQAFDALTENDAVIGPSADGGYWLIGLTRPAPLFQNIDWGTGAVLGQTLALAHEKGLRIKELNVLTDMDTAEDLKQLPPGWTWKKPYISVVIPALNEEANIAAAIRSAFDEDVEVIVADGGSTDNTVKEAVHAGAFVTTAPRGRSHQQNRGAALANGSVLLFLHADSRLPSGYVNHVFDIFMDPNTVVGSFRFKTDLESPAMKTIEFLTNIRSKYLRLPYGDQGLFIRKPFFEAAGGFPDIPIAEDLILLRRLSKKGRIKVAPANVVTSGRRWKKIGLLRTMLINQIILAGCLLGISPSTFASLYKVPQKK